jgi:hypothetical protein
MPTITDPRPWFAAKLAAAMESDVVVPAITTAGDTTLPAATLYDMLQAIADLADPGA